MTAEQPEATQIPTPKSALGGRDAEAMTAEQTGATQRGTSTTTLDGRDTGAVTAEQTGAADCELRGSEAAARPASGGPLDDLLARRARLKRLASFGQRSGYALYAASLGLGAVGIRWGYTSLLSTLIAVALVVGSMLLAPTIVMSYGIKAAEREERQQALRGDSPVVGAPTESPPSRR